MCSLSLVNMNTAELTREVFFSEGHLNYQSINQSTAHSFIRGLDESCRGWTRRSGDLKQSTESRTEPQTGLLILSDTSGTSDTLKLQSITMFNGKIYLYILAQNERYMKGKISIYFSISWKESLILSFQPKWFHHNFSILALNTLFWVYFLLTFSN